jgi:mono/diheme cytochrome c family protein
MVQTVWGHVMPPHPASQAADVLYHSHPVLKHRVSGWIFTTFAFLIVFTGAAASVPTNAQGARKTIWEGVYTRNQAARGELAYRQTCGYCHGLDLGGSEVAGELAPELEGAFFLLRWDGPLSQLFIKIDDDMPKDAPGTVTSEAASDIVGYLLSKNDAPAGESELPPDREKLKEILVTKKPPK